jgi:hypothetical protein
LVGGVDAGVAVAIDQPRRFMADQPHAMGYEVDVKAMRSGHQDGVRGRKYFHAGTARPDRSPCSLLTFVDVAQEVVELGIWLPHKPHLAKVADVAAVIAA